MKRLILIFFLTASCSTAFADTIGEGRKECMQQCQMMGNSFIKCFSLCS